MSKTIRNACKLAGWALLAGLALTLFAAPASAASPRWQLHASAPDTVPTGKKTFLTAWLENTGEVPLSGSVTITDTFPSAIPAVKPAEVRIRGGASGAFSCEVIGQKGSCEIDVDGLVPGGRFSVNYLSDVGPASGTLENEIAAEGGGMAGKQTLRQQMIVGPPRPFAVKRFAVEGIDGEGQPQAGAGTAPYELATAIAYPFVTEEPRDLDFTLFASPLEHFRSTAIHLPAGMIGDPTVIAGCAGSQLAEPDPRTLGQKTNNCPEDSQVGTINILDSPTPHTVGLYSMAPPPGYPAAFGFTYQAISIVLLAKLRPDNGVDIVARTAPSSLPIPEIETTFWGVPYDHRHDYLRHLCMDAFEGNVDGSQCPVSDPPQRFLRLPTSCPGTDLPWSMEVDTYEQPGNFRTAQTTSPATTDCGALPFEPGFSVTPSLSSGHTPTGLDATISLPQDSSPDGLAEADLRRAEVTLPQGMAINPYSAEGLAGCSDAQLRLGLEGPSECPDASKLGTLELQTPLLDHSLQGSVFLRSQGSGAPESGDLYRLVLEVRSDEDGIAIKLPGSLAADPTTGRLTTVFDNLPQLPFEVTALHLKAGTRAPLLLPSTCGTYSAHAELTSWSGKTVSLDSPVKVDKGCDSPPFAPGFSAGVQSSTAGAFSPLSLRVTRDAGQPNLSRIDATLPEGELAKLAGVPLCPEAAVSAAACPASSRIGQVVAAIGDGPDPLYLPQPGKAPTALYLAGPYKGAPYSVLASVPAQAGPFDLGTVAVRSALRVDPETTRASVLSDPLPQIHAGIPVSYRDVRVQVDRPGFTLNPTDCEPKAVEGTLTAANGASAAVSERFQASDCAALAFKPRLSLSLRGKTARTGHPALTARLTMPQEGANIARASVALPHSEFLAQAHIKTICTRVQFAAGGGGGEQCPKGSVYGHARAFSPLLDRPLSGPVYLRSSSNPLPDLVAALDGQIHVDLVGRIDSKHGGIRTTFASVPDAPVSKFVLAMQGGKKGLLENSTNLCRSTKKAAVRFDGQNGRSKDLSPVVKAAGCKGGKKGKRR